MNNKLTKAGRKIAFSQILFTTCIVIVITLIIYFILGASYAISALGGGLVAIVPNIVFALKAFQYAGAQSSKKVVESFFSGVKLKMVLTALLFALAFKFLVLLPIPFFVTFCLVMVMPLITPLFLKKYY
ncbi:ATP synthase subunit I [Colwellia sp. MSW7]|uniref:ATP synthase subunit I n=1 Tax=Colwellia maritima TaxID=2912588 RepID=A0ABS9WWS6_9GAMM|nr:ATP synthase subunit I [Colwellia maritima]MCI2282321.1 ATP synthase subunit I [Colwellia maritima]